MRKNIELSQGQEKALINCLYDYFSTGEAFEQFLKVYLEQIGLDEVTITQRTRDGGRDIICKRAGIGDFSDADEVNYYVQAKRYRPGRNIRVPAIRELKGTLPFGYKGIFITTSDFTKEAIKESNNDISKPVILINGKKLVESCIDNDIAVVFTPSFSKAAMDSFIGSNEIEIDIKPNFDNNVSIEVEKIISKNDIRARILRIPTVIKNYIGEKKEVELVFSDREVKLTVDASGTYLASVTQLYKDFGLIQEDGSFVPQKAIWRVINNQIIVELTDTQRDYSKYVFEGETYNKCRLVLAVVNKFINDNGTETIDELKAAFDIFNMIRGTDEAPASWSNYYSVTTKNGTSALVDSVWPLGYFNKFLDYVKEKHGYAITKEN